MEDLNMEALRAVCETEQLAWKVDFIEGKGDGQVVVLYGESVKLEYRLKTNHQFQVRRE